MQNIQKGLSAIEPGRTFSREEYYAAIQNGSEILLKEDALAYSLRKSLSDGDIVRVSWNQYAVPAKKRIYRHDYSEAAKEVAAKMQEAFSDVRFQIFELIQLNEFVNHLIAHNTIFLYVENDVVDYAFDALKREYAGRIMLKPSITEYYRYLLDDEIVVGRLPSESPKGLEQPWETRLEKILVDIAVDKLLSQIVPAGEYRNIFTDSIDRYFLDTRGMFRYAKRKGAEKKFRAFLEKYKINLEDDGQ